jgi:hypothetical protein
MKSATILIFAMLVMALPSFAQPDSLWSRTYGGTGWESCYSVAQTEDGGYVMSGNRSNNGSWAGTNAWIMKTNGQGDSLWGLTFGGPQWDNGWFVRPTADGGYSVAGSTESNGAGAADYWLTKWDANGNMVWNRTYGGTLNDWAHWGQQTADGGYIIAGASQSYGHPLGVQDCWVVKTNSLGTTVWTRTFGGALIDGIGYGDQTMDGGYIFAALTQSFGEPIGDFWLIKTDTNGNQMWNHTYGGPREDWPYCVRQTADSGYLVTGYTTQSNGYTDAWLLKTDASGDSLWSVIYGGPTTHEFGTSVLPTSDGGCVVVGGAQMNGGPPTVSQAWMFRTDGEGNVLWSCDFGGPSYDMAWDVLQTADGGYVLAGYTYSFGAGGSDVWLIKTGPDPVAPPDAPQALTILITNEEAQLNWQPSDGATAYHVYGSSTPDGTGDMLATVSDTTWTDPDFAARPPLFFYYVTAE